MVLKHKIQEDFGLFLETLGRSPYTIDNHQRVVSPYIEFLAAGPGVPAAEVSFGSVLPIRLAPDEAVVAYGPPDARAIREFISSQVEVIVDPVARSRKYNRTRQSLHLFHQYLLEAKLLWEDPTIAVRKVPVPRTLAHRRYLTRTEYADLETAARALADGIRNLALIRTMRWTGIRPGELRSLTSARVDLANRVLYVRGKSGERPVPVMDILAEYLAEYMASPYYQEFSRGRSDLPLFPSHRTGDFLSAEALNRVIKKLTLQAGIPIRVIPYTLRHTFATLAYEDGISFGTIVKMLGHERLQNAFFYLHLLDEQLRRISSDNAAEGPLGRAFEKLSLMGIKHQLHLDFSKA